MSAPDAPSSTHAIFSSRGFPWLLVVILLGISFALQGVAYWRSSSAAAQVQVPMFYDAHYLFPRPWTQQQSAPGVPDPAPVAIYGDNTISQSFIAGSDNLARAGFYLAAQNGDLVHVSLAGEDGSRWEGDITLSPSPTGDRAEYSISFPPQEDSKGKRYTLTLSAPETAAEQPLIVHTVGGDRLGDSLHLNEFIRPGNAAIHTYTRGLPGRWWFETLGEQLLPMVFRLRLQQYKPPLFKGNIFAWLLAVTIGLSAALLVLAAPGQLTRRASFWPRLIHTTGWFLVILIGSFLVWQLGSGRVHLAGGRQNVTAASASTSELQSTAGRPRLAVDLVSDLWTAVRQPEARFVSTDEVAGYPAIVVPGDSRIAYSLVLPPDSSLRFAAGAQGRGAIDFIVRVNEEILFEQEVPAQPELLSNELSWQELDLDPWAGPGVVLALETALQDGEASGLWFMPQISTDAAWLLAEAPDDLLAVNVRFGETAELLGIKLDGEALRSDGKLGVRLYWRLQQESDRNGTVFVHLLDGSGQIAAQHDAPPVQGAYPFAIWQRGAVLEDEHILDMDLDNLAPGPYQLAIGVYEPDTLQRWTTENPDGTLFGTGTADIQLPAGVLP